MFAIQAILKKAPLQALSRLQT